LEASGPSVEGGGGGPLEGGGGRGFAGKKDQKLFREGGVSFLTLPTRRGALRNALTPSFLSAGGKSQSLWVVQNVYHWGGASLNGGHAIEGEASRKQFSSGGDDLPARGDRFRNCMERKDHGAGRGKTGCLAKGAGFQGREGLVHGEDSPLSTSPPLREGGKNPSQVPGGGENSRRGGELNVIRRRKLAQGETAVAFEEKGGGFF